MKANSNTQAMGTEKIPKLLAQLAIPAVVAQVVNLLYNIVDRIYIGHISGIGASASWLLCRYRGSAREVSQLSATILELAIMSG